MSFGWGVGDIVGACQFLWQLSRALDNASGAPEHYRRSAATLSSIRFRLMSLKELVEGGVEARSDADIIKHMISNLKSTVDQLAALVTKGSGMNAGPKNGARHFDWAKLQFAKLCWYFGREAEIDNLIRHINDASTFITDIHLTQRNEISDEHFISLKGQSKDQYESLKALMLKVDENITKRADVQSDGVGVRSSAIKSHESPHLELHVGPESGIPIELVSSRLVTLLQQAGVAYDRTVPARVTHVSRLFVDSPFQKTISGWLTGARLPVLWLYGGDGRTGSQSANVSLGINTVMMSTKRATITFAARHNVSEELLGPGEQILRMVFSLLIQVLHLLEEAAIDTVPMVAGTHPAELSWSSASISMALSHLKRYLGLLPDCICIVDGWNFICSDLSAEETGYVYDFLNIFSRSTARPTSTAMGSPMQIDAEPGSKGSGVRLLLTSRANVPMLRQMSNDKVHGFDLGGHVGTSSGILRLDTVLRGIKW